MNRKFRLLLTVTDMASSSCTAENTPLPVTQRTVYSDRFIPSRSSSNFSVFDLPHPPTDGGLTTYSALLRATLFGIDSSSSSCSSTPTKNIFRFKTVEPRHSLLTDAQPERASCPLKPRRTIPNSPSRILDAPNMKGDFYLNLLDWSWHDVLAVGLKNEVYLWRAPTSQVTKLCELGPYDEVSSVAWALRGEHIAVGTRSGTVQLWDAARCRRVRTMAGHEALVGALAWSRSLLSSGSIHNNSILQRDVRAHGDIVTTLTKHKGGVCGLKWSQGGCKLASAGGDHKVLVWNQHSTQPVSKYSEHKASVKALAWSPHRDGLLASGGGAKDRCIRFWNTNTDAKLSCVDTGSQVCNLAWSKSVDELVSAHGYHTNQVLVWRYPSMSKLATLIGHTSRVLYLAGSPDGKTIVTGGEDEILNFWNVFPSPKSRSTRSEIGSTSLGRAQIR